MAKTVLTMVFETEVTLKANGKTPVVSDLDFDVKEAKTYDSPWYWIPSAFLVVVSVILGLALPAPLARGIKSAGALVVRHEYAMAAPVQHASE
jgi:hypothetical protein